MRWRKANRARRFNARIDHLHAEVDRQHLVLKKRRAKRGRYVMLPFAMDDFMFIEICKDNPPITRDKTECPMCAAGIPLTTTIVRRADDYASQESEQSA